MDGVILIRIDFDTYTHTSWYRKAHRHYGEKNAISRWKLDQHVCDTRHFSIHFLNGRGLQHGTKNNIHITIRPIPSLIQWIRFYIYFPPEVRIF